MNKVLFISHNPHQCHLEFAKSVNAKIAVLPFKKYVTVMKSNKLLGYFYPIICLFHSFFFKFDENILLVEGGSSLYTAVFLKNRNKNIKIIYLDCDLLFYNLSKLSKKNIKKVILKQFIKKIDAIISVSEKNKEYALNFSNKPIQVAEPFCKDCKKITHERKNYGLYIGRLDSEKNIKRIVEFGLQCPYFEKFIIVGDGSLKKYVQKIAKNNSKILYFDKTDDVEKFYSQCSFLIHIPNFDPYVCTAIEAARCGCFPIMSEKIGASYLFDEIFTIKNPDDFEEVNKKIYFIKTNKEESEKKLEESLRKIPTKEESIKNFEKNFNILLIKI